jgi:hypothetical protein
MLAEWLLVWMTMTGAVPEIAEFSDQGSCETAKADKIRYGYRHISAYIRISDIRARQLSGLKPFDGTVEAFRTDPGNKKFAQSPGAVGEGRLTPRTGTQSEEQAMSPAVWFLFLL